MFNKEEGQSAHDWRETGAHMLTCVHSQEIVPLLNNQFSVVYWPGNNTGHCITFVMLSYEFVDPFHELILSIMDKTHVIS
jgi:hypothetical protein